MMPPPSSISVKGVKTSAKVYENTVLEPVVKLLTTHCSVMNIGALNWIWHLPARQTLPRSGSGDFPDSITLGLLALQQLWPQPNGLQGWAVLEHMICKKRHPNIEILKCPLMKAVADFPKETLLNSIDGWPQRLRDCVKTKGGHFEIWLVLYVRYTCR